MSKMIIAFRDSRRGAVALIFALALVPLVLLVGLSIDYSFYAQARAQIDLAADAAASHAIRAANATFTLETAEVVNQTPGSGNLNPTQDAKAAGMTEGLLWFNAQLATLPTAYIGNGAPTVVVTSNAANNATGNLPGFDAKVTYGGLYPPFFGGLFGNNKSWQISGESDATSPFNYIEVDMLLDTSASMLIGAQASDIAALEEHSVCPPNTLVNYNIGNPWSGEYYQANTALTVANNAPETTGLFFNTYTPGTQNADGTYNAGKCKPGYDASYNAAGQPAAPCAFACHTDTNSNDTGANSKDLYGVARSISPAVTLRLDVVLSATENIINSMITSEQAPGQFAVGVYRFDNNVYPIAVGGNGDNDAVATTSLSKALTAVTNIDYVKTPGENVLPGTVSNPDDNTDFPLAMTNIYNGKTSQNIPQFTAAGDGTTPTTPLKDLFIVTDGMEDDGPDNPFSTLTTRTSGTMTGVKAEQGAIGNFPALCGPLKSSLRGYTIYVLYITYYPLANTFYQTNTTTPTGYFQQDYNGASPTYTKSFAENTSLTSGYTSANGLAPDVAALQACASSPSDFYTATSTSDINNAMNAMLEAALSTTVRVTN